MTSIWVRESETTLGSHNLQSGSVLLLSPGLHVTSASKDISYLVLCTLANGAFPFKSSWRYEKESGSWFRYNISYTEMHKDAIISCRHVCVYSTLTADPVLLKHLQDHQSRVSKDSESEQRLCLITLQLQHKVLNDLLQSDSGKAKNKTQVWSRKKLHCGCIPSIIAWISAEPFSAEKTSFYAIYSCFSFALWGQKEERKSESWSLQETNLLMRQRVPVRVLQRTRLLGWILLLTPM
nr:uncharacterized protein LOC110355358 [Columba livia]